MPVEGELLEAERVARDGGKHDTASVLVLDHEEAVVAPAISELIVAAAAHPGVIVRIYGIEHPDPAIRVGVKHEQIAVVLHPYLDLGVIASLVPARLIERDPNGRIILGRRRRARRQQRKQGK